ncbi:DUF4153 domain-containing protein [Winogradskyella sp. 3972H.M.0a.05]|uniref:DUF4153 domain-containing protein n=1 Tax=Winogradskyella sp. 3972H.M.0a.05 TaxID=2950277 RepID=UPI00339AD509
MKHIITIIAAFMFSILFYDKHIGLNLSIFSLITIALLAFYNPKRMKNKTVLLTVLAYLLTAIAVFIQHTSLSIIANCAVFFTLVGVVSEHKTSIYVHWLNGLYTSIAGFFHRSFGIDKDTEKVSLKKDIDVWHWAKLIGIPAVFIVVFVLLYKNGNPMFNDLINKINFDFINLQWILFSVLGYYLFSNISRPIQVEPATSADLKTSNILSKPETISEEKLKKEKQLGTTLIGLLNTLIIFYIITDIASLVSTELSSAPALSSQVHSGINALIASIVIAIVIILYFFRGDLNFYSENKTLKNLTYLWIILNIVLVALIAIKNHNYISSFGLTYKRIGVNVYILLTLIGLITTFLKVMSVKNLVYLFRINTQFAFVILIALSTINWDKTITEYNIHKAKSFDIDYLIKLTDNNAIQLYDALDELNISNQNEQRIREKYDRYLGDLLSKTWQESNYDYYSVVLKRL